jgi:hypothetical protein
VLHDPRMIVARQQCHKRSGTLSHRPINFVAVGNGDNIPYKSGTDDSVCKVCVSFRALSSKRAQVHVQFMYIRV